MTAGIGPQDLKKRIREGGELAILDVREEGAFARGHLLFARSLPFGRIELRVRELVPRFSTPIVLCAGADGLADGAAERLSAFGYGDLAILEGGVTAWEKAGFVLFGGVFVPSKAFGEFVETAYQTDSISAPELKKMLDAGEDVLVLDSRPYDEYRRMSIPTGIDAPGAELAYRVHDLVHSPETLVVVNCAGRTRSIIGAQSLINACLDNKVVALKNGTMGWRLAGFALDHGKDRRAPDPSPEGLEKARAAARRVAARFGVNTIDRATLDGWTAESDRRSLFLFDVRNPEEYLEGHLPGSVSAPGGQLVQATDRFVGTLGSRIVLIDDTGVRATMTASWLIQNGWKDVAVLEDGLSAAGLETGMPAPKIPGFQPNLGIEISPEELECELAAGRAAVVDLALSRAYRAGHIPGAWFAVRSRLKTGLAGIPATDSLVLTSEDGILAHLAADEARSLSPAPVQVLAGGTRAWQDGGRPIVEGFENLADETDDVLWRPDELETGVEAAMNEYLSWELGLVEQIERDGDARFEIFPA